MVIILKTTLPMHFLDRKLSYCGSNFIYRKVSNISHTLVGTKIVDQSDVVGASPVGATPNTSSFSTYHLALRDWTKTTARRDEKHLCLGIGCVLYQRIDGRLFPGVQLTIIIQHWFRLWFRAKHTTSHYLIQ